MSLRSRKPTICICQNKDADQLCSNCADQLISAIVLATQIVLFLFYLYAMFQASSFMLSLYRLVCAGPARKPKLLVFSYTGSNQRFVPFLTINNMPVTLQNQKRQSSLFSCFFCLFCLIFNLAPKYKNYVNTVSCLRLSYLLSRYRFYNINNITYRFSKHRYLTKKHIITENLFGFVTFFEIHFTK